MVHRLFFAGHSSLEYGIYISGTDTYKGAERVVNYRDVPGRNGSLVQDEGRYKNIPIPYKAFVRRNFPQYSEAARQWLLAPQGYQRLEDDYHLDEYRMAVFAGPVDFVGRFLNLSGEVTLNFNCMPQRWLKSGEKAISITSGKTLYNAWQPSEPLIQVVGNGTLHVGKYVVTVKGIPGPEPVSIDSAVSDAWQGTINRNENVELENHQYPILEPGEVTINYTGFSSVSITPRWWRL